MILIGKERKKMIVELDLAALFRTIVHSMNGYQSLSRLDFDKK